MHESHPLIIRPSADADFDAQESVMCAVYHQAPHTPESEVFSAEKFRRHRQVFPEGQFVAVLGDRLVGFTVSMRFPYHEKDPIHEPWLTTISDGWLTRHDPAAEWLYGVETCVMTEIHSRGIGGALMHARFDLVKALNLRGIVGGSGLISYRANVEQHGMIAPEDYITRVEFGTLHDTNLTKQIKKGFKPVSVIPNYLRDPNTMGWGALIVWHNPDYTPTNAV